MIFTLKIPRPWLTLELQPFYGINYCPRSPRNIDTLFAIFQGHLFIGNSYFSPPISVSVADIDNKTFSKSNFQKPELFPKYWMTCCQSLGITSIRNQSLRFRYPCVCFNQSFGADQSFSIDLNIFCRCFCWISIFVRFFRFFPSETRLSTVVIRIASKPAS